MAHYVYHNNNGWLNTYTNETYTEEYLVIMENTGVMCIYETNPVGLLAGFTAISQIPKVVGIWKPA